MIRAARHKDATGPCGLPITKKPTACPPQDDRPSARRTVPQAGWLAANYSRTNALNVFRNFPTLGAATARQ